ncbi:HAD hydrolase-like protein [Pseudonocardia zijingensis]|uniref:HAD family hydrolase n=1 Tax=Pseudonocardia zijingensis TaxID=153376 RepID=A0ABP3ZG02_9PSEU
MRTVLLDLDGTLVDSAPTIVEHLAAAIAEVGFPVPDEARLRRFVGPPFETALPELGLTPEQTAAAIVAYRRSYDAVAATVTPVFPGVPEFLARLREEGLRLATATSKPEELARKIVAGTGLDGFFDLVGGADHVAGRVGKAAVVGSVLQRLRLEPARHPVVLIGDRHHDVDGGAAHGVPVIGVGWGYAEPGELAGARRLAADLDDLAAVLRGDDVWSTTVPRDAA